MFTITLYETSTKGGCQPDFPAIFQGMPAQKTREQPASPVSAATRFILFFPGFYCFGNMN